MTTAPGPNTLGHPGGVSALCTLALLNAGRSPHEDHVRKHWLISASCTQTTYVVSLQTMVLCRADPGRRSDPHRRQRRVAGKEPDQERPGRPQGGWSYGTLGSEPTRSGDGSNSQFALLALYEAGPAAESGRIQRHHPPRHLGPRPHLLDRQPVRRTTAPGATTAHGRHRQHDLRRHRLAGHRQRHPPPARRPGRRRPDRLLSGPRRKTRTGSTGASIGCGSISPSRSIRPCARRSGLWHFYYLYGLERAGRLTARR